MEFWDFLKTLTDPTSILHYGGIGLLLFVIFAETGLMVGFFLPGDSLIFVSGMFCSTKPELLGLHIVALLLLMMSSAILGNIVGYWFGKKAGPALFKKENSLIFKKRYLEATKTFYARHERKTLVLGRFLPIIRTFAPILAGAIKINFKKFMLYNILGAFLWIGSLGLCGFFLGRIKLVEENVGWIVIFLIIITMIPVAKTWRSEKKIIK
ncbi:MAG: VTT domain-containing protein [Bacteroidetes bacterium]|nr:VTT domain-containing protein [Bacteroidota bacterium]